jgi:hypothetical protein
VEGATAAAAARASKVFLLWLPFGRPRFRDAGGIIFGALASFSLPSGILPPPMAESLRADMTGLGSERRGLRRREKWECALSHRRSQHLKRSGEGDDTRCFGNHPPHCVPLLEDNRCDRHNGSWEELTGHAADACQSTPHDDSGSYCGGDSEVKMTRQDTVALCWLQHGSKTQSGTSSKGPRTDSQ